MISIRKDSMIPNQIKTLEIMRLLEVHNTLEIESIRQQEEYMKCFLESLKLEEIGARPMTEGRLKCHIAPTLAKKLKPRAISYGFCDTYSDKPPEEKQRALSATVSQSFMQSSGILVQRKVEINRELAMMSQKAKLTEDEEKHRKELADELAK
ncbi:hypothetical protein GPJ56_003212 [Histomonas meleagridis]|nr:hypothetical protein GPJ56_003212 [Histomonas meleagridis]